MHERTAPRTPRSGHARTARRRGHGHPEPRIEGGGGSSGRGPVDDDGGRGKRPDGDGDQARRFLVVLGLLVVGAGVLSARLLATSGKRRPGPLFR